MKIFYTLLFALLASGQLISQHTFSIVAIDVETGAIGSAGATCLNTDDCPVCTAQIISDIVPGKGAINAQARVCIPNINLANGITQVMNDSNATQTLGWLLANDACNSGTIESRQYGIVTIDANNTIDVQGYTGADALDAAGHRVGANYSVQGNILIEENVLDSMEAGFLKENLTFAEKMMAALQGANRPGADSRCFDDGISSRSAYLRIANPDDAPGEFTVDLHVPILGANEEPIDEIQNLFNEIFPSSTEDIDADKSLFEAYPNPTENGMVTFETRAFSASGYQLVLLDLSGKVIETKKVMANIETIDFSDLHLKGTYFYKIQNEKNEFLHVGKLIFF